MMTKSLATSSTLATFIALSFSERSRAFLSPHIDNVNVRRSVAPLNSHQLSDHNIDRDIDLFIDTTSNNHVHINSNCASSNNDDKSITTKIATAAMATSLFLGSSAAWAVSGGGLDYANLDITGQDFSNGNYKGKDFTQVRYPLIPFAVFLVGDLPMRCFISCWMEITPPP